LPVGFSGLFVKYGLDLRARFLAGSKPAPGEPRLTVNLSSPGPGLVRAIARKYARSRPNVRRRNRSAADGAGGGLRIYLLGAAPGVADRAAGNIRKDWPAVEIVGTYSPPIGFERDAAENEAILNRIAGAGPDVLIIGLGAPKQELWVHQHRGRIAAKVALCVGATIDFLAGERKRAPMWMREAGLEWLYRVALEPRRLAARYAKDALIFPRLVAREWWRRQAAART